MTVLDNLKLTFKNGNTLIKLIFVNVAVFLFVNIFLIALELFKIDASGMLYFLEVPSNFSTLLHRVWTPITYMFLHVNFMHVLFNMLAMYWFGKIFLMYYSEKQLLALYFFGGLIGAVIFILTFNFIPLFNSPNELGIIPSKSTFVLGASGSIISIVVASAVKAPNAEMRFLFIGSVKLIYVAIATVLVSVFGIIGNNSGGEIVHLGGALAGYIFVVLEKNGKDITPFFNKIVDFFVNLFRKRQTTFKTTSYHAPKMSDSDYNRRKTENETEINRILDKIKTSGYESLSTEEKRKLFEQKR